jgi:peptidoglycan/LPS O-acetylase OafA/YrhL
VFSLFWSHSLYWDVPAMVVFWRTGFAAFLACMVAAAVCLPQSLARRWLRPLDYLGDVSYGIYLWHLFAVELVIHMLGVKGLPALAAVLVLTILAASISWRWFERPFMALGRRPAHAEKKTPPAGGVVSDSPKAAST